MLAPRQINNLAVAFLVLAIIGFADATFLTIEHYRGGILPCVVTSQCDFVTTSKYSLILGIPVALLGAINYLAIIVMSLTTIDSRAERWLRRLAWWTGLGFGASLYFVILQAFVLHAYCFYCLISAGLSTLLFALGLFTLYQRSTTTYGTTS